MLSAGTVEFDATAGRISIRGTDGDDHVAVTLGSQYVVDLNGQVFTFPENAVNDIQIEGLGGQDELFVIGTNANDNATLYPGRLHLQSSGVLLAANGFPTINVQSGGGQDRAFLYDSPGDDFYVAAPLTSLLNGADFSNQVEGFRRVYAYSYAGGRDTAELLDSTGNDNFVGLDIRSWMTGAGYYNSASRFDVVYASSEVGGYDIAMMWDSTGDDSVEVTPQSGRFTGTGFDNRAVNFDRVYGYAYAGGYDVATLFDSMENDRFVGREARSILFNSDNSYYASVSRFELVRAIASSGGTDRADLYGTSATENVIVDRHHNQMVGANFQFDVSFFEIVNAYAVSGGSDTLALGDSIEGDRFGNTATASFVVWANGNRATLNQFSSPDVRMLVHAYALDNQYGFRPQNVLTDNWGSRSEKWLLGKLGWFFITPDGRLYLRDSSDSASGELIAQLSSEYYDDLALLYEPVNDIARVDDNGTLSISGTSYDDHFIVATDADRLNVLQAIAGGGFVEVGAFDVSIVGEIEFEGLSGDDIFENQTSITSRAYGGDGDDLLWGGTGNDWLFGGNGDDELRGGLGNDFLNGDTGDDLVFGDAGHDVLVGGTGFDHLQAEGDGDLLIGDAIFADASSLSLLFNHWINYRHLDDIARSIAVDGISDAIVDSGGADRVVDSVDFTDARDWGFDAAGRLHVLRGTGRLERQVPAGWELVDTNVIKLMTRTSGGLYYLTAEGHVRSDVHGSAVNIWSQVRDFHVDPQDRVTLLSRSGSLERQTPEGWEILDIDVVKLISRVSGGLNYLTVHGTVHDDIRGKQVTIWANVKDFHVDPQDRVLLLAMAGTLERQTPEGWELIDSNVEKLLSRVSGTLLYLTGDGTVHDDVRGNSVVVWGNVRDLHIDLHDRVLLLSHTGTLERQTTAGWDLVDTNVIKLVPRVSGQLYYLKGNGGVHDDIRGPTVTIWGNVRDIYIDAYDRVVLLANSGTLERQSLEGWQLLDDDVRTLQVGPTGEFYSLGHDRVLWRHDLGGSNQLYDPVVSGFSVENGELWVQKANGDTDVTYLAGDIALFLERARQREATNTEVLFDEFGRGIVGQLRDETFLENQYGHGAAQSILNSVVYIKIPTSPTTYTSGTGTLLAYGGNRYVLTAAHVVMDDKGLEFPPSMIQVRFVDALTGDIETFAVSRFYGRSHFGGRDLALLELTESVQDVQGAALNLNMPGERTTLLNVGFGNNDVGLSGNRLFGYTTYENIDDPDDFVPSGMSYISGVGLHLINDVDLDREAATQRGDSGGPDFYVRQRKIGGQWVWVPEIVGVHSFGTTIGATTEETASVLITRDVVDSIRAIIGHQTIAVDFYMYVDKDGDELFTGWSGEWYVSLIVNNAHILFSHFMEVSDVIQVIDRTGIHFASYELIEDESRKMSISFYGYEDDTFGVDEIPRLDAIFIISDVIPGNGLRYSLGSRNNGDIAYELYVEYRVV